jgi:hypothetical protein
MSRRICRRCRRGSCSIPACRCSRRLLRCRQIRTCRRCSRGFRSSPRSFRTQPRFAGTIGRFLPCRRDLRSNLPAHRKLVLRCCRVGFPRRRSCSCRQAHRSSHPYSHRPRRRRYTEHIPGRHIRIRLGKCRPLHMLPGRKRWLALSRRTQCRARRRDLSARSGAKLLCRACG